MIRKENRQIVRQYYPSASCYCKNGYYYVVPVEGSGNTLGSGNTSDEAWEEARLYVEELNG
jgi:hypothetical protein